MVAAFISAFACVRWLPATSRVHTFVPLRGTASRSAARAGDRLSGLVDWAAEAVSG
jgi:hypothetical protein